ncbi:hypothetical protein PsorP6_002864 [Peronosclerospora sorghi]|uniref:Uncharacterized protein n=1 Tax=Peronosclerospora sorghi TaxID=230839 RepID=A0ACC0VNM2_9STRA|nr:hypothetical protein PsorP6_002864 [Peronosclerospora sorghi]
MIRARRGLLIEGALPVRDFVRRKCGVPKHTSSQSPSLDSNVESWFHIGGAVTHIQRILLGGSQFAHMKSKTQFQDLIQRGQPVVADFIAPWCGKCAQIEPFVLSLAEAHPDVTFAKLDVSISEVEELRKELDVEVHDKVSGYKKSFLKKAVQTLL